MKNPGLAGAGLVVALFGLLFTLQGVGLVKGSPMTGTVFWSIAGPVIIAIGLAIAAVGVRGRVR